MKTLFKALFYVIMLVIMWLGIIFIMLMYGKTIIHSLVEATMIVLVGGFVSYVVCYDILHYIRKKRKPKRDKISEDTDDDDFDTSLIIDINDFDDLIVR